MIQPRTLLLAAVLATLVACGAAPELPENIDAWALELEESTLRDLAEHHPEAVEDLDRAIGYAIFANHADKVPAVGRGEGLGVAVDPENGQRRHLSVTHFYVGGASATWTVRLVRYVPLPTD